MMTHLEQSRVRDKVMSFADETSDVHVYREVGAKLTHKSEVTTKHVTAEWLQRRGQGEVTWRLRQKRHAFFFFEEGIKSFTGQIESDCRQHSLRDPTRLAFIAAGTCIDAIVDIPGNCTYTAVFIDPDWLCALDEELAGLGTRPSRVGFENSVVVMAMAQLRNEIKTKQPMSRLVIESWTMQMWANLLRSPLARDSSEVPALPPSSVKKVVDRMREGLADDMSIKELAAIARLGPRQFCRRYRAATGTTPARSLEAIRLDHAAMLLSTTRASITDIALECGYSQPQHLATAFRRRFEVTPTQYRSSFD
jgi:AraC family transcriptional regulator